MTSCRLPIESSDGCRRCGLALRGNQNDRVAVRGCLRIGPITCKSDLVVAVEKFASPGVPLAILAAPKPQQGRFYVAESPNGEAQQDGLGKVEAGYSNGKKRLRRPEGLPSPGITFHRALGKSHSTSHTARKPHWPLPGVPTASKNNGQEQRDDQNRSILGWVKPGAVFRFDLHVQNISKVELGVLLWLLTLREEHYYRLGGGKPLALAACG